MTAQAADFVTITYMPGHPVPEVTNTKRVLARVEGRQFEAVRKDVEKIAASLGPNATWSNWGPDAAYLSAEISLGGKKYTIDSWYPLHKDDGTIAVLEKPGVGVRLRKKGERAHRGSEQRALPHAGRHIRHMRQSESTTSSWRPRKYPRQMSDVGPA